MSNLKKNIFYSALLTVANYAFPLITYPYVSRVLGVTNIGICNFVDNIVNYFLVFSTMGISILGVREIAVAREDRSRLDRVFSSLLSLNALTTFISAAVLLGVTFLVPSLFEYRRLLFVGVAKLVANGLFLEWLYQGVEQFQYITRRSILIKTLYVVSVFLFVRTADDYEIYFLLLALAAVANALVNAFHSRKYVSFKPSLVRPKGFVKPYFILGINFILTSMYTSFNVMYLGLRTDADQVGFYTSATKILSIVMALFSACATVLLPRMSAVLSEGKTEEFKSYVSKTANLLFLMGIPVLILMEICTVDIIQLISGSGYEGAVLPMKIVSPMILIAGMDQILIIQIMMPMKMDQKVLRNSAIGASVAVLLSILLVGRMGANGSAVVWIDAEFAVFLAALFAVRRRIGFPVSAADLLKTVLSYVPLIPLLYACNALPVEKSIFRLCITGSVTAVYFIVVSCFVMKNPEVLQVLSRVTGLKKNQKPHGE